MALSNIFREPRREITESAVGLSFFAAYAFADYRFARWFQSATSGIESATDSGCPWGIGMFLGIAFTALGLLLLIATHAFGELVCNSLAQRGIELRPKNRPRR